MQTRTWTFLFVLILFAARGNAATLLIFNSEPGDYIGQGEQQTWTDEDGTFSVTISDSGDFIGINFHGTTWWNLNFAAPSGEILQTGTFDDAARYPFQSPTQPGLSISGDGRGCNTLTGRFDILELSYNTVGEIEHFAADFEQHCEGSEPALYGSIRINSTVGLPTRVDIEANGKDMPITVTVGEPVTVTVKIDGGDEEGVQAEYWLGKSGSYGAQWFNGSRWIPKYILPTRWKNQAITTEEYSFDWIPRAPGVYMFQCVIDETVDGRLNTQFADHVVVTVLRPTGGPASRQNMPGAVLFQ
ncbi:hypothetical protein ACLG6S_08760 [Thermodesulfobacteriota bacterium B35]